MSKNFSDDFDTSLPDYKKVNEDVFDRLSPKFQEVVYEMAMHGDVIYTSSKSGVSISDIHKLQDKKYFLEALQKAKDELNKDGSNPIKAKANILAHIALDKIHQQMIDPDIKESDRTKACTVMLEIAGQYNNKEEVAPSQPVIIQFKDATFETNK